MMNLTANTKNKMKIKEYIGKNIDDFPISFDIKSINDELNICDKCGNIDIWTCLNWDCDFLDFTDKQHKKIFGKHTAVCDDCLNELRK